MLKEETSIIVNQDSLLVQEIKKFYEEEKTVLVEEINQNGSFVNITLQAELMNTSKDLEQKRFEAFKIIGEQRTALANELTSKQFNVVNIVVKKYKISITNNVIIYTLALLVNNTDIKDYVTGRKKEVVKESKSKKNSSIVSLLKEEEEKEEMTELVRKKLDKLLLEYEDNSKEIDKKTIALEKELEQKVTRNLKIKDTVIEIMKKYSLEKHQTDNIIAVYKAAFSAKNTKWKEAFVSVLEKIVKKYKLDQKEIDKLSESAIKDNTNSKITPEKLDVKIKESKELSNLVKLLEKKTNKSVSILTESFIDSIKALLSKFKSLISSQKKINEYLQKFN